MTRRVRKVSPELAERWRGAPELEVSVLATSAQDAVMQCQWTNFYAQIDDGAPPEHCSADATHTTCDPKGAVVCEKHKCRCSKPLEPLPVEEDLYVAAIMCGFKPSFLIGISREEIEAMVAEHWAAEDER